MLTLGILISAKDMSSAILRRIGITAVEEGQRAGSSWSLLGEKIDKTANKLALFGAASKVTGNLALDALGKPIGAFIRLDDAMTDLQVAMLDNSGKIGKEFGAIKSQAIELGNLLPGTTTDFTQAATALIEQGTALSTVLNGGLRAASNLGVVMKIPPREAAEMTAKLREAYGLADNELERMADLTQRAKFAFGMKPDELKAASAYSGATINILGLKGIDNAKKLLALQGLGAGVSLEGSSWGTNFSMMLARTAESRDRLAKNSKEMRAINADLKKHGIQLDFFDQKGDFMGVDNMVRQIEKVNVMSKVDKLNVFKKLFGAEAGRPAMIIAEKGFAGYQEAIAKMDQQASLQQRINLLTQSSKSIWDSLTGTMENVMALMAGPAVQWMGPYITSLNGVVGKFGDWVEQHKEAAKWTGLIAGGMAALLIVVGTVSIAAGVLGKAFAWVPKLIGKRKGKGGIGGVAEALAGGDAQKVFVTNWPGMGLPGLGGAKGDGPGILGPDGKPIRSSKPDVRPGPPPPAAPRGFFGRMGTRIAGSRPAQLFSRATAPILSLTGRARPMLSRAVRPITSVAGRAMPMLTSGVGRLGALAGRVPLLSLGMSSVSAYMVSQDKTLSDNQKKAGYTGIAGGFGGGLAGAAAGAAIGSIVPIIGTAIGGLVGGILGSMGGDKVGSWAGGKIFRDVSKTVPTVPVKAIAEARAAAAPQDAAAKSKEARPLEVHVHYNPTVTIQGDPLPGTKEKFLRLLEENARAVGEIVKKQVTQQQRTAL